MSKKFLGYVLLVFILFPISSHAAFSLSSLTASTINILQTARCVFDPVFFTPTPTYCNEETVVPVTPTTDVVSTSVNVSNQILNEENNSPQKIVEEKTVVIRGQDGVQGLVGSQGPQGERGERGPAGSSASGDFVTQNFFSKQVDGILSSIEKGISGLYDQIKTSLSTGTLNVSGNTTIGGDLTVTGTMTGNIAGNASTVTNGVYTNVANSMSVINPLTTLAESWIGPSSTTGIYFKDGAIGMGTTTPEGDFTVQGDSASVFISDRAFGNAVAVASRLVGLSSTNDVVAGFGVSLGFSLEDSAGTRMNNTGGIDNIWENPTPPNRATALLFKTLSSGSTGNTEKMRLSASGDLGIGTKTPLSRLHVANSSSSVLTLERVDTSINANDEIGEIKFSAKDASTVTNLYPASIKALSKNTISTDINPGILVFSTTGTDIGGALTERMRIDENGNVGIGTTTPTTALEVNGIASASYFSLLDTSGKTIFGNGARASNTANDLTAFGYLAANSNTVGNQNTAFGYQAGKSWTDAHANTAVGFNAASMTNGVGITAVGSWALEDSTGSSYSTAIGSHSMEVATNAINNTAVGYLSLGDMATGSYNTGLGDHAGRKLTTAQYSTMVGSYAGWQTTGGLNTILGAYAGYNNLTGSGNIFLGQKAGYYETGSNKLFIDTIPRASEADARTKALVYGFFDGVVNTQFLTINGRLQVTATANSYIAGNLGVGNTSPTTMLTVGTASTNTGNITVYGTGTTCVIGDGTGGTSCTSDLRLKDNITDLGSELNNLMALKPVTFNWKDKNREQNKNMGLIAQEVQSIYPSAVHTIYDDYLGIDYTALVVPTIKSVQELNLKIESLAALVDEENEKGFSERFFDNLFAKITSWLADAGNGIGEMFVNTFNAKEKICINNTCLTETELQAILQNANITPVSPTPAPTPEPDTTTPLPAPLLNQGGEEGGESTPEPAPEVTTEPDTTTPPSVVDTDAGSATPLDQTTPEDGQEVEGGGESTMEPVSEETSAQEPVVEPSPEATEETTPVVEEAPAE